MVTIEYRHRQGAHDELLAALRDARFSRRRTGATSWRVWQDATDPDRIIEQFIVASWDDHLRQHERVTRRNAGLFSEIRKMTDPGQPAIVTRWLTPRAPNAEHDQPDRLPPVFGPAVSRRCTRRRRRPPRRHRMHRDRWPQRGSHPPSPLRRARRRPLQRR